MAKDKVSKDEILIQENPFRIFVSRSDIPDEVDIIEPRAHVEEAIVDVIKTVSRDRMPYILPVLGEAGYGKTHLYWALKKRHNDLNIVYITPPLKGYDRLIQHVYFSTVKNLGYGIFEKISENLEKAYGDLDKAMLHNPGYAADLIQVLKKIEKPELRDLAVKYLCGTPVSKDELEVLCAREPVFREDVALQALKILTNNLEKPLVLFLDELEAPYLEGGEESQIRYLENVKRIFNECKNIVIIMACLTDIWSKIISMASSAAQGRTEKPKILRRFTAKDITEFCQKVLSNFWTNKGITTQKKDSLYPLSENDFLSAYRFSHGNPREAIRWIKNRIEEKRFNILKKEKPIEPIEVVEDVIKLLKAMDNDLDIKMMLKGEEVQTKVSKDGSEVKLRIKDKKLFLINKNKQETDVSEEDIDTLANNIIENLSKN
jgi:hypothetical protein